MELIIQYIIHMFIFHLCTNTTFNFEHYWIIRNALVTRNATGTAEKSF